MGQRGGQQSSQFQTAMADQDIIEGMFAIVGAFEIATVFQLHDGLGRQSPGTEGDGRQQQHRQRRRARMDRTRPHGWISKSAAVN